MRVMNLWESGMKDKYKYVNTIEEVLELINDGVIEMLEVSYKYTPGEIPNGIIEESANKQDVEVTFVDEEHILAYSENPFFNSYVYPPFFEQYKEQLILAFQKQILESEYSAWIQNVVFSDELFEKLLIKDDLILHFVDIDLTDEQIKRLRDNHIKAYIHHDDEKEQISDNIVIGTYTKKDLKRLENLYVDSELSDEEIANFKYLKEGCIVTFGDSFEILDLEGYKKAKSIIEKVNGIDKKLKFKFFVDKRSKVEESGLLEVDNANIILVNDLHEYSLDEYKEEEKKLYSLIEDIKDSSMSPFERYIAVYNIVKNYKPYKESNNSNESRYLRYILDNEYMVCVGYSKLFIELLDKVGISAIDYQTDVDISYKDGFTQEEKVMELSGHRRVMVNLDDDKYNIHGIYVSDPTWDNNVNEDYYNHLIMTFDSMQVSNLRFRLTREDLIFDVNDFDDFVEKTNIFLKRESSVYFKENPKEKLFFAYNNLYDKIMYAITSLDDEGANKIAKYQKVEARDRDEEFYINFLTDAGHYIVERTNNKVPTETIMQAISTVKVNSDRKTLEEQYEERQDKYFPYEEGFYTPISESKAKR